MRQISLIALLVGASVVLAPLGTPALAQGGIKWSQPPDPAGLSIFYGWNENSENETQIVADDWECTGAGPVTQIQWWGSYVNWAGQTPPGPEQETRLPEWFNFVIWTDIASGPGECVWAWYVPYGDVNEVFVGYDVHPSHGVESCFAYSVEIPEEEWFYQQGEGTVYWLTIYGDYFIAPWLPHMWGWKTRPHNWNHGAVTGWPPGFLPWVGEKFSVLEPIEWDMAFLLSSIAPGGPYLKWDQPPAALTLPNGGPAETYNGWDEYSVDRTNQIVADDWNSTGPEPVTDIHWWGSFIGWSDEQPPHMPDKFHICIWTDVPAGGDPPWSHPGRVIWETYCENFTWELVGWDVDPRDPNAAPDACFKFEQDLGQDQWFWPEDEDTIYWVSIAAYYNSVQPPDYAWGWKTRPRYFSDDAVMISNPTDPHPDALFVSGEPIEYPQGVSWDMAFELTTLPTLISIGDVKKLPVNTPFVLKDKVLTADFTAHPDIELFYIEEEDRSAGIGVMPTVVLPALTIGDRVTVIGTCVLINGTELVVNPMHIMIVPGAPILPVGTSNRSSGGGMFGGQPGVSDDGVTTPPSFGLNYVGMLIRTWGKLTYTQEQPPFVTPTISGDMFWIDDGTNLHDGFLTATGGPTTGVACLAPPWWMAGLQMTGQYWAVTGILKDGYASHRR